MVFCFGDDCQQEIISYNSSEKQVNLGFSGEIYSSKTKKLYKRDQDDIQFHIMKNDSNTDVYLNSISNSDIVPKEYEGGLKTWECSLDLVDFITPELVRDKIIIELGCGSALPGIKAVVDGAKQVDFQDFNERVLELVTFPNLLINTIVDVEIDPVVTNNSKMTDDGIAVNRDIPDVTRGSSNVKDEILSSDLGNKFYAGDWADLSRIIPPKTYDIILTSETIYSSKSIPRLLHLIDFILKDDGIILLAAKKLYFGCSGGLEEFKRLAGEAGFESERISEIREGVSREIIKLWRIESQRI